MISLPFNHSKYNRTESVHGTLAFPVYFILFFYLTYCMECAKIFIMNRYISKSCTTTKKTIVQLTQLCGERMKDGKFISSVKQMWKWIDQHVTSVRQRKKLSPRQDSNLWPPKHRTGALSTWTTENSWRARPYTRFNFYITQLWSKYSQFREQFILNHKKLKDLIKSLNFSLKEYRSISWVTKSS